MDLHIHPAEDSPDPVEDLLGLLVADNLAEDRRSLVAVVDSPLVVAHILAVVVGSRLVAGHSLPVADHIDLVAGLRTAVDQEVGHRSLLVERLELTHPSYHMKNRYYRATI